MSKLVHQGVASHLLLHACTLALVVIDRCLGAASPEFTSWGVMNAFCVTEYAGLVWAFVCRTVRGYSFVLFSANVTLYTCPQNSFASSQNKATANANTKLVCKAVEGYRFKTNQPVPGILSTQSTLNTAQDTRHALVLLL